MKEIKIWKALMIWFLVPFPAIIALAILQLIFNLDTDFNEIVYGIVVPTSIFIVLIKVGKINIDLIKERYNDYKEKFNLREMIGVVVTQLFLSIGLSYISEASMAIFDKEGALAIANDISGNPTNLIELSLFLISIVIIAPLLEEILFRRILFVGFSKRLSFLMSAIISSIIFAIGHDIFGIASAAAFGIACCILYKKYKNILASTTLHFINNLTAGVAIIISYFMGTLNEQKEVITNTDIINNLIIGGIITIISLILFIKFIIRNKDFIKKDNEYINSNIN